MAKSTEGNQTTTKPKRGRPRKRPNAMDVEAVKPLDLTPLALRILEKFEDGTLVEEFFPGKGDAKVFRVPQNDYEARDIFAMVFSPSELRYVETKDKHPMWYRYNGKYWETQGHILGAMVEEFIGAMDQIYRMVQQDINDRYFENLKKKDHELTQEDIGYNSWVEKIMKYMSDLRNNTRRKHSIAQELLSVIAYRTDESLFDADPYFLNVENGTIDLRTAELRKHDFNDLCRKFIDVEFDPSAKCDRWERVFDEITCGDEELNRYLQIVYGYSASGLNREKYIFIHHGDRDTGKTLTLKTLDHLFGSYSTAVSKILSVSRDGRGGGTIGDYVLASLHTKRLGYCSETGRNDRLNADRIKMITGGDTVQARHPYGDFFCFEPSIKAHIATNHMPDADATDEALWERLVIIPYKAKFAKVDKTLGEYFQTNDEARKGLLAWVVEGARLYFKEGIDAIPQCCIDAKETHRFDSDEILQFIDSECETEMDGEVTGTDLYVEYQEFMRLRMRGRVPMGRNTFYEALATRSNDDWKVTRRGSKNQLIVRGLVIKRNRNTAKPKSEDHRFLEQFVEDRCKYGLSDLTLVSVLKEEMEQYADERHHRQSISDKRFKHLVRKIGYPHDVEIDIRPGRNGRSFVESFQGIGLKVERIGEKAAA